MTLDRVITARTHLLQFVCVSLPDGTAKYWQDCRVAQCCNAPHFTPRRIPQCRWLCAAVPRSRHFCTYRLPRCGVEREIGVSASAHAQAFLHMIHSNLCVGGDRTADVTDYMSWLKCMGRMPKTK